MRYTCLKASLFFVLGLPSGAQQQVSNPDGVNVLRRYQTIELKAQQADAQNLDSIQSLAHEVIIYPHTYSSAVLFGAQGSSLSNAEIAFRNKRGPGVTEAQLVDLLNWMAAKFRLPDYIKTTPVQVRTLRMKLAIAYPYLMGRDLAGQELKKGDQVHTTMSPIQAMHLLNVMVDQKILNPDYQDPSIDILAAERERIAEHQKVALSQGRGTASAFLEFSTNSKKAQLRSSIATAAQTLNAQDISDITDRVFKTFHLE